jgi:hypothetical protein
MKQIELKAVIGDSVYFMESNEIKYSEIYCIEIYNTVCWFTFKKTKVRYKFWNRRGETIMKRDEDVFLSKEELLKSLGDKK